MFRARRRRVGLGVSVRGGGGVAKGEVRREGGGSGWLRGV